jgi:hypothetical protein
MIRMEISRVSKCAASLATDHNDMTHDFKLFKSFLDSLTA